MSPKQNNLDPVSAEGGVSTGLSSKVYSTYQKASPLEISEEDLLQNYATIIAQMVHRFAPIVRSTVDIEDLKSIASMAVIQASRTFNPTLSVPFEVYCRMRIRGSILDELRRTQPLTRSVISKRKELERTIQALSEEIQRQPTEEEISEKLGMDLNEYHALLEELRPVVFVPIDQPLDEDEEYSGGQQVEDITQIGPADRVTARDLQALIRDRLMQMPANHKKVLTLFYYEELRLKDIAELLKVSESRVCQIHTEAIISLRAYLQRKEKVQ